VHVLLIDDDPIVLMLTSASLEEMGHRVTTLPSALEATEVLLREQPDIVIVDQQMPELSGEEWLRSIATNLEFCEETVFVILSGAEVEELERLVRDTCAVAYIRKVGGPEEFAVEFEKLSQELAG
jgi:CheY-like chemotaxis protein